MLTTRERLISADALLRALPDDLPYKGSVRRVLMQAPEVDAVPVVHGRWDDSGRYTFPCGDTAVRCTNCGCALTESEYHMNNWNYCPVCGAKMDGGDGNEA